MHKRLFDRFLVDTISACSPAAGPRPQDATLKSEIASSGIDLTDGEVKKFVQTLGEQAFSAVTESYKGSLLCYRCLLFAVAHELVLNHCVLRYRV